MNVSVKVEPKKLLMTFGGLSCLLTLLHLVTGFLRWLFDHPLVDATGIFDVGGDSTIPTWYSALMLCICSALSIFIGWTKLRERERYGKKWITIGSIFLLMSIDEVSRIHETLGDTFGKLVQINDSTGLLHYEWVILGFLLVLGVALYCLPLVVNLPRDIKTLFIVSATVYVLGGLGIEMINGRTEYVYGSRTILYAVGTGFEELCEMLGTSLFIYSFAVYIKKHVGVRLLNINLVS